MNPRIIVFDIETMPIPEEIFRQYTILSNWPGITFSADLSSIICIGWKYLDERKTHCINAWDFPNWKKNKNDDSRVLKEFLKVVKDADGIITQNGKGFDFPFVQTRLILNDLETMFEGKHADTKKMAKKLKISSKSLKRMGYLFGDQRKSDSGGWDTWCDIFFNDCEKAKRHMEKYCKQDVKTTESVFYKLRQFAKGRDMLPNMNMFRSKKQMEMDTQVCSYCKSENVFKNGCHYTNTQAYQRLKCKDCGGTSRLNVKDYQPRPV